MGIKELNTLNLKGGNQRIKQAAINYYFWGYFNYPLQTKKEGAMEDSDVQEKAQAALQYCKYATEFTAQNSGKPWKYVLIPHSVVQTNMSFDYLVRGCEQKV